MTLCIILGLCYYREHYIGSALYKHHCNITCVSVFYSLVWHSCPDGGVGFLKKLFHITRYFLKNDKFKIINSEFILLKNNKRLFRILNTVISLHMLQQPLCKWAKFRPLQNFVILISNNHHLVRVLTCLDCVRDGGSVGLAVPRSAQWAVPEMNTE